MRRYACLMCLITLTASAHAADDLAVAPLKSQGESVHYPRLTRFPDAGILKRVNDLLVAREKQEKQERADCVKQGRAKSDSQWFTSIEVTHVSRRFLSIAISGEYFCPGNAHPSNGPLQPINIDLTRGTEMDWKAYFKSGFLTVSDPKAFLSHPGKLAQLYRARYAKLRPDKEDSDCREAIASEEFLDVQISINQKQRGIVINPELPHVIQACGEDIVLRASDVTPYIADANLIAELRDLDASKPAKN